MDKLELLKQDIKQAMIEKNKEKLDVLRSIRAQVLNIQKSKSNQVIDDQLFFSIIKNILKESMEVVSFSKDANRADMVELEERKIKLLEQYLPEKISDEQMQETVLQVINDTANASIKDMGNIMKKTKELLSKSNKDFDMSQVSKLVKERLK